MDLLWYIILANGNWQIGTSDGIYDMKWQGEELIVEKEGTCLWKINNGLQINC